MHAIRNIAGRRTTSDLSLFSSVSVFEKAFKKDNDIFAKDILTVNFMEGKQFALEDYLIDKDYFKNPTSKNCYRYIHLDIASRKDRFGLSSVYSDMVSFKSNEGLKINKRMYFIDFCVGIVASSGCEVDIIKVFEFLYNAKKAGYPIKLITTDSHQGILARQHIKSHGVNSKLLSVETSKEPYYNLKTTLLTESLIGYKNEVLVKELKGLREYDNKIGKSKGCTDDLSDSLAGALYSCMLDKHHFKTSSDALDNIIKVQSKVNPNQISNISDMITRLNGGGELDQGSLQQLGIFQQDYLQNDNSNKNRRNNIGLGF